ncbi:MAG: hypothetical protein ACK55I_28985, partial [bacterium]
DHRPAVGGEGEVLEIDAPPLGTIVAHERRRLRRANRQRDRLARDAPPGVPAVGRLGVGEVRAPIEAGAGPALVGVEVEGRPHPVAPRIAGRDLVVPPLGGG